MLTGVFSAAINISISVKIQLIVPESLRGKYWGFGRSITGVLIPIGSAIVGVVIGKVIPGYLFLFVTTAVYIIIIIIPRSSYTVRYNVEIYGSNI